MKDTICNETPNADTISAIREVQALKNDPDKRVYRSFGEVLEELDKGEFLLDRDLARTDTHSDPLRPRGEEQDPPTQKTSQK
ncbi:MAG: hypothetical protein NC084_03360 [Bacteroides sp.]|nr:hypothetical protein [Eubacterium sp.]MCM1417554.1 hypothetical protein [Roseburia sp.]MCM1461735.1 hypothetical protein [Bacteroides sp.]